MMSPRQILALATDLAIEAADADSTSQGAAHAQRCALISCALSLASIAASVCAEPKPDAEEAGIENISAAVRGGALEKIRRVKS